jgi:carbohydrate binding protein with CBM4/9 domain/glycosyl hydrolase family 16
MTRTDKTRSVLGPASLLASGLLLACGSTPGEDTGASTSAIGLPANNLVVNPSFEKNLDGWYEWQGSATRVYRSDAPNGHYVAQVRGSGAPMYSIGDAKPLVASIPAGRSYHASAYVRAASSSASGKPLTLVLRERDGAGNVAHLWTSTAAALGPTFVEVTAEAGSPTAGDVLDVYVLQENAEAGDAFDVDAVAVVATAVAGADGGAHADAGGHADAGAHVDSGGSHPVDSGSKSADSGSASDTGSGTPSPLGVSGTWTLIFDDEFTESALDTTRWAPYWFSDGDSSNGTPMESTNVAVSGGYLDLTLTSSGTGGLVSTNPSGGASPGFQFTYGFMEARIDLPGSGTEIANWPAWWADGQDWPTDGEIDVVEGLGGTAAYHFHDPSGGPGASVSGNYTGWHTFGANWQPGSVTYYYDGKAVGSITSGITSAPMYLLLENSGGAYSGPSVRPATMQVDYVRVWQ